MGFCFRTIKLAKMKKLLILLLIGFCALPGVYGQNLIPPQNQGFEQVFTFGKNVEFVSGWWASEAAQDTLWQESLNTHSGNGALAAIPYGEEESAVDLLVQTTLDMSGLYNATCSFWAATEETGGDKSVLLFLTTSIDDGVTWSPLVQIGNGETFPNANTPYVQYLYPLHPGTNDQANVILRFVIRSGERRTPIAKLLIDDVYITDNEEDIFKPTVVSTTLLAADSIRVVFSEPMGASAATTTNYSITQGLNIEAIYLAPTQDSVTLKYSVPLEPNLIYTLGITNVADLTGNVMDNYETEVTYHVALGGLVITEIFYDNPPPEMNDQLEFIELYNASTEPISLEGLQLKEAIFSGPLPAHVMQPGEYWIMTMDNSDFESTFGFAANYDWMASNLANEGDYLALYPAIEHAPYTLDSVRYGISAPWPTEGAGTGASIELINAFLDNSIGSNWVGATEVSGTFNGYTIYATPGRGPTGASVPSVDLGPNGNRCGLTQLILDAGNPGSKYLWSTGEETQTISITQSGTYSVIVNNGIGAATDEIEVAFVPAISAQGTIPGSVCGFTAANFAANSSDATQWLWDFGDGEISTEQNPEHTYTSSGNYTVELKVSNSFGCSDSFSSEIEVLSNTVDWTLPLLICQNTEASFENNNTNAESWSWDFGDGSTSLTQNAKHTFASEGPRNVKLTVTNSLGCTNTLMQEVQVNPNRVEWTLPAEPICTFTGLNFADNSPSGTDWTWEFGDGGSSTQQNPNHIYSQPGVFQVKLTVTNTFGCTSTAMENFSIGICVGTEDPLAASQRMIYPNPSNGLIYVKLEWGGYQYGQLQVINETGKVLLTENLRKEGGEDYQLDVSPLTNGLYLVRIQVGNEVTTRKLVVRK